MHLWAERKLRLNYAPSVRARMVRRMIGPNPTSQAELARETGIPQATLSRWCREAGNLMPVPRKKRTPEAEPPSVGEANKPKRPQIGFPGGRPPNGISATDVPSIVNALEAIRGP